MYIVVVGAGAMGCLFGGFLQEKGHRVVLADVWRQHIEEMNTNGLRIETSQGERKIRVSAKFIHEVEGQPDLLIIFTKTFHTENALKTAKGIIGNETVVLTLQNGLGNVETIEKFVPRERIIAGITNFPSDLIGPGMVRSLGYGETIIMQAHGEITPQLEKVRQALNDAGFNCKISKEVFDSIWEKVAFNAAMNSVTAVTGLTVGQLGANPEGVKLARRIVEEAIAVAGKKGLGANKEAVLNTLERVFVEHAGHKPSMLQDILARRKTEIEAINCAIVKEAEKEGIPTPTTEVLCSLVRILEQSYQN